MADTLIREAIAYGSQPLSPVPQYWDGSSYAKVQGINGAIRVINYNSAGETLTNAIPGTVQIVTSAGSTNSFSASNPAHVQLTATSTVNFSGSGTVAVSGTATINFSGSGTVVISGTSTVSVSGTATVNFSGSGTVVISGTSTVAISGNVTALNQIVGTHANAWSASATISSGATSNTIDITYNSVISAFGEATVTATLTINFQASQDNINFYNITAISTVTVSAGTSVNFYTSSTNFAFKYVRLIASGVSATITATIAGK